MRRALAALLLALPLWCLAGEDPPVEIPITGSLGGAWWDPERAGEGVTVDVARTDDGRTVLFIAWFTYLDGGQQWIAGNVDLTDGATVAVLPLVRGTGAQFGAAFDPADVTLAPWGEATVRFFSCRELVIDYTGPDDISGLLVLQRLVGLPAGVACGGVPPSALLSPGPWALSP